jgi:hypothetical protein
LSFNPYKNYTKLGEDGEGGAGGEEEGRRGIYHL